MNTGLPVIGVKIDYVQCSALVDTECSQSKVSANHCQMWRKQQVDVMTINGLSQASCGVGTVMICDEKGDTAEVDVLVMQEKPFAYNLLLGIDAIRAFKGVMITAAGGMTLGRGKEVCAAISIEEKDFYATFNNKEYAVSTKNRTAYEEELQVWIINGWLIPYQQERLGSPKGLIPLMAIEQPT